MSNNALQPLLDIKADLEAAVKKAMADVKRVTNGSMVMSGLTVEMITHSSAPIGVDDSMITELTLHIAGGRSEANL